MLVLSLLPSPPNQFQSGKSCLKFNSTFYKAGNLVKRFQKEKAQRTQEKRKAKHKMTGKGACFQSTIKHTQTGVGCSSQDRLTKAGRDATLSPATDQSITLSHGIPERKQSHPCLLTAGDADGDLLLRGSSRVSR